MPDFRLSHFTTEITVPLGHRLMGVLPMKAQSIADPLYANGFVLTGTDKPIVFTALDWCEVRNGAYERLREVLAEAAGTDVNRVILSSLHQHDAPVTDIGAENLLARVGLAGELFDLAFHEDCIERTAAALKQSLKQTQRITHVGTGQAQVEKVASNRRIQMRDGSIAFSRGSSSGGDAYMAAAPEGQVDPHLKTLSFWDGDKPLLAYHAYATHPMSHYGKGEVSADFVGMARHLRQSNDPGIAQIYVSGCSGDVTAGKYNNGNPAHRAVLANRLHHAMKQAWETTTKHALKSIAFRAAQLDLEFRKSETHTTAALTRVLHDQKAEIRQRILAAMGLSSRQRIASGKLIDFPIVDFGAAQVVLFPGESFVGYQLLAQAMRPDSFVVSVGYGECWPGYIPTAAAFADNFTDVWLWVAPGAEERIKKALAATLTSA